MKITTLSSLSFSLVALVLASGCGPKHDHHSSSGAGTEAQSEVAAPAAPARPAPTEGRAIEVTGNDAMKFAPTMIRATPGEALAVTFKNIGTMPKAAMGHNWVLLAANVSVDTFAADSARAAKNEYLPTVKPQRMLAATKLLGPGESDTVLFYAPTKPGRYVFICSFPGHPQSGMKGELVVE